MCWSNTMAIPIVLKKPLIVYKVGKIKTLGIFISLYQNFRYYKFQIMPTVEIDPKFERHCSDRKLFNPAWYYDCFYIHKGYHSYLTKKIAKYMKNPYEKIGIFEIPAGATVYINYACKEVVSTDIKYLGLLKE